MAACSSWPPNSRPFQRRKVRGWWLESWGIAGGAGSVVVLAFIGFQGRSPFRISCHQTQEAISLPWKWSNNPEYQRHYQREWKRKNRQEWENSTGGCVWVSDYGIRCGSFMDLEAHHRDPQQKDSSRIWSWGRERREKELAKCDPMCHAHHVEWHKKHGNGYGYRDGMDRDKGKEE